ncbi:MAG: diguanylate cyclase [Nitrospirota bacterium]
MEKPGILIIDDDPNLRKTLSDILTAKGYQTHTAGDGTEGIAMAKQCGICIALIDLVLPDIPGIEVLNRVKADNPLTEAIILTGNATLDTAIEATNKDAFSYMQKPYDIEQLLLHLKRATEKQEAERMMLKQSMELKKMNMKLKALYEEAKSSSLRDPLTGLANRRLLEIQFEKIFGLAKRYGKHFSIIMLDIDHFKKYNDTHGHIIGDGLLVKIANTVANELRDADHVFRYGGEEFLILLPETNSTGARFLAERLRKYIESQTDVTVSLGVASYCESVMKKEDLIKKVDDALYQAKQKGRNRVEVSPDTGIEHGPG